MTPLQTTEIICGYIDKLGRPLVRLSFLELREQVLARLDTGKDFVLLASWRLMRKASFRRKSIERISEHEVRHIYEGHILHFGYPRKLEIRVATLSMEKTDPPFKRPEAIVGTGFLERTEVRLFFSVLREGHEDEESVQISQIGTEVDLNTIKKVFQ